MKEDYKQVILVRKDLPMSPGKLAVQINHATAMAVMRAGTKAKERWMKNAIKVVIVEVDTLEEMVELDYKLEAERGIPHYLATDLGVTEFEGATQTALAIGPAPAKKINRFTSKYSLFTDYPKETVKGGIANVQEAVEEVAKIKAPRITFKRD
jgi:PTH2 family peptidyl-tRNA hydrolase